MRRKSKIPMNVLAVTAGVAACLALGACSRDSAPARTASAQQLVDKKDYAGAAIQYKAAVQLEPDSGNLRRRLGRTLLDGGDPAGATVELTRALELKEPMDAVLPDLSRALLLTGDAKKLTRQFGDTVLTDKNAQAAFQSNLAQAWAATDEKAKAQASLNAALQAVPGYGPALVLKAALMAGNREFGPALDLVDSVLAKDSSLYEGWMLRGEILNVAKNDQKGSREAFLKALSIDPRYIPAHAAVISAELANGDIPAAKAQAAKLRAILPQHPQTTFVDALIAYSERDIPKSRELIQQVLKVIPDNVLVLQLAGVIEAQLGSLVAAQAYLSKALAAEPGLDFARLNLARVFLAAGQPTKTLETLQPLLNERSGKAEAFALAGDATLRLGDATAAREWFNRATKANPDDVKSRTTMLLSSQGPNDAASMFASLGSLAAKTKDSYPDLAIISARMSRGEYPEALAALDSLASKEAPSPKTLELRGRILLGMRDAAGARAALEKALQLDPKYYAATSSLAEMDLQEKKPELAQKRVEASIAADPANYYARMQLANIRMLNGAPLDEVQKILVEAIRNSPGAVDPRLKYIDFLLRKRLFKDALAVADEAAAAFSNNASVLEALGRTQLEAGNPERAISTFGRLASLLPASATPHLRLAAVYRAMGQRDLMEVALKNALEAEPANQQAQKGMVSMLVANGRTKEALALARGIQQKRPDQPDGYMMEATLLLKETGPDAAVDVLRKSLAKVKNDAPIAAMLYATLYNSGKQQDADKFATAHLKQHPEELGLQVDVGAAASASGDYDRAEALLNGVLAKQPNHAVALNNLAWIQVQRKNPKAVELARRANDLLPNDPGLMETLALALALNKQLPEALAQQKRAVELAPADNDLHLTLARIAVQAGDKALAKTELDRLRALGTGFPKQDAVAELTRSL